MRSLLLGTVATIAITGAAIADPLLWDFSSPLGDLGPSHTYVAGGIPVVATAFGPNDPHLFGKNLGVFDEIGLGLTNDASGQGEITPGSLIDLDISALAGIVDTARLSFQAGSIQDDEIAQVWGSDEAGVTNKLLAVVHDNNPIADIGGDIVGKFSHLQVSTVGNDHNVLVQELDSTFSPISEPSTLAGLGTALIVFWRTRRKWQPKHPNARETV